MSDTEYINRASTIGKIDASKVRNFHPARVPQHVVEAFRNLGDISSAVSDALDELGLPGAIPSSALAPGVTGSSIVGVAITLRNEPRAESVSTAVQAKRNGMADIECHNLARPGDVLVVQGVPGASNLGGVSSRLGRRQGELGAIVDGGVRDLSDFVANDFPVWSTEVTPKTGKWRVQAAEINGTVNICGVPVQAGDLVVADSTGVCFVPRLRAMDVLVLTVKKVQSERETCLAIDAGTSVRELAERVPGHQQNAGEHAATRPSPDRLPPIPTDQWSELQRRFAKDIISGPRGALISPFVPLLRSPELMDLAQRMGEYLRYRSSLGARLFELAVLLVARHWSQQVEWAIHAPIALAAGVTQSTVASIRAGERPDSMPKDESVVYRFCIEILTMKQVSDPAWQDAQSFLGEMGTMDLLGVCGYYGLLAMVMNAARTPVPETAPQDGIAVLPLAHALLPAHNVT